MFSRSSTTGTPASKTSLVHSDAGRESARRRFTRRTAAIPTEEIPMPRPAATLPILLTAALSLPAAAQVADLTVQPGQSGVTAQICVSPPALGTRCDTDTSGVTGSIAIELDDYGTPTAITLHDFVLALSDTMTYNMDWGFFVGGIDIDLSGVTVSYATPGTPTGPVGVNGAGDFEFPAVQAVFTGAGTYAGYGPIMGGLVGSGSFNLADFGAVDSAIAGNVSVAAGQVALTGSQAFSNEGEISGVTTSIDGTATLSAVGEAPACPGDFNGDGLVNTVDVLAFLNAWAAGDSAADCNGDGSINTVDVLCFLNAWAAGC
jgi:hypothetical protein